MNPYIRTIKRWYEFRNLREKIFFISLCWAIIYAIFSFIVLIPLNNKEDKLIIEIKNIKNQIYDWNLQISALNKLTESSLYKEWMNEEKQFNSSKQTYRKLLRSSASVEWESIIKSILFNDKAVIIEQIKNSPETPFTIPDIKTSLPIYQQKLVLTIYSNYFDTIRYLKIIQSSLPTIHWDSLTYEVQNYPIAKVQMEFSVLYEKSI